MLPLFFAAISLNATSPKLNSISPPGGQRGTELELKFSGERFHDAQEIILYNPGIEVLKIEENKTNSLTARVKIAPTCHLGEHPFRVRTATGLSELRTFFVGALATTNETEPNNAITNAQSIPLNCTVNGTAGGEDIDYYRITAKKGQPIALEVEAMRLGRGMLDAYIALQDKNGKILASSDDTALLRQDPALTFLAPEDGEYIIQMRESTYTGSSDSPYRLHVGTFPRPTAVFPAGGKTGEKLTVKFIGDVRGEFSQEITLPSEPNEKFGAFAERDGQIAPSPNWMRVSPFGNVLESEPNDERDKASGSSSEVPVAFNGILSKDGDVDWFRFKAKKDQAVEVAVFARRIRSPVDSVVEVVDAKGSTLAQNDDGAGPDSVTKFTASADGEYFIKVTDQLKRGGPDFVYRIEVTPVQPTLAINIPQVARNDSQTRQYVTVAKGNRFGTLISVKRNNFSGDLQFKMDGLPGGITLQADTMSSKVDSMPLVFEAAADAPVTGKLLNLSAASTDTNKPVGGSFRHDLEFIQGPNNTFYYHTSVDKLYVAVTEPAPYKLEIDQLKVPLVQAGSMALKIKAIRDSGFEEPITIKMLWNPPGVSSATDVTIGKGETNGTITLNANGGAELRKWKIAVLGSATVNGGTVYVSSQLASLEIGEPFVSGKIETVSIPPGQSAKVVCKLEQKKPFEGKAKVKLMGLPDKVTAPEVEITKDDKEAVFDVKVDPKCSNGSFKNLFCSLEVPKDSEVIPHSIAGGGVLRVGPPKKDKEAKVAAK